MLLNNKLKLIIFHLSFLVLEIRLVVLKNLFTQVTYRSHIAVHLHILIESRFIFSLLGYFTESEAVFHLDAPHG